MFESSASYILSREISLQLWAAYLSAMWDRIGLISWNVGSLEATMNLQSSLKRPT